MAHDYDYWNACLAGQNPPIDMNAPQPGLYRMKTKQGLLPVVVSDGESEVIASINGETPRDALDIWTFIADKAITREQYDAYQESGRWWDDAPENPRAHAGDNLPLDEYERLRAEIDGEAEIAAELLADPVETQDQADRIAAWVRKMPPLAKRADTLRAAEKQPYLDGGRKVDAKWRPLVDEPKTLADRLRKHLQPYFRRLEEEERERRRKAAAEAEAARQKALEEACRAEELRRQQNPVIEENREEAEAAEAAAKAAAEAARKAQAEADAERRLNVGRTGAKVSYRTVVQARITDIEAVFHTFIGNQELTQLLQKLADRAVRAGLTVAGAERIETNEVR